MFKSIRELFVILLAVLLVVAALRVQTPQATFSDFIKFVNSRYVEFDTSRE